jgi:hypothetical protein
MSALTQGEVAERNGSSSAGACIESTVSRIFTSKCFCVLYIQAGGGAPPVGRGNEPITMFVLVV